MCGNHLAPPPPTPPMRKKRGRDDKSERRIRCMCCWENKNRSPQVVESAAIYIYSILRAPRTSRARSFAESQCYPGIMNYRACTMRAPASSSAPRCAMIPIARACAVLFARWATSRTHIAFSLCIRARARARSPREAKQNKKNLMPLSRLHARVYCTWASHPHWQTRASHFLYTC